MPTRPVILKLLFTLLAGLGILTALFGLGIDFLLPSSYPGLNLSQLAVIVSGLLLFSLFFAMRSAAARRRIWETMRGYLWTVVLITAVTLLALELVLSIGGAPTYYPTYIPETPLDEALWRACDDTGCHFIQERMDAACARGLLPDPGRYCMINRQGFSDMQDFVAGADFDGRTPRILILGDSFTWGMSADLGKSYVETIEANFPEGIVWNTGMPGTGTREALSVFRTYAPALQPQIAILGFYKNDFQENVLPVERWIWRLGGEAIGQYQRDSVGMDIHPQSPWEHTNYFAPPPNEIQRLIGVTRLGSLALRMINVVWGGCDDRGCQLEATRDYLRDLRDAAAAQDTALLILLIPHWEDLDAASQHDQAAAQLMKELNLPYLDPRPILDLSDYATHPDDHWNSAGHQKVGALLNACIETWQITGDWAGCEQAATP